MDEPQAKNKEHIPECTEVKLAYDLAWVPFLGLLAFIILYDVVCFKLGRKSARQSFWLRKAKKRLFIFSGIPLIIVLAPMVDLDVFFPPLLQGQKAANDNAAQAMLKSIITSQATYNTRYNRYAPSLSILASSGAFNKEGFDKCTAPGRASDVRSGYIYEMTAGKTWTATTFYVRCRPESASAGTHAYSTNATGKIVSTEAYQ